jgi:hypothetical protein
MNYSVTTTLLSLGLAVAPCYAQSHSIGDPENLPIRDLAYNNVLISEDYGSWYQITFSSGDSRPYEVVNLGNQGMIGRLRDGSALRFVMDRDNVPIGITVEQGSSEIQGGAVNGPQCRPEIDGFIRVTQDERLFNAAGIWRARQGNHFLIVTYPRNFRCPANGVVDTRFRIVSRSTMAWRLISVEPQLHSPPLVRVLSNADVGNPITYAVIRLLTPWQSARRR